MILSSDFLIDTRLPMMTRALSGQDVSEELGKGVNSFLHLSVRHP